MKEFGEVVIKHKYYLLLLILPFVVFWRNFVPNESRVFFGNDSLLSFYTLAAIMDNLKAGTSSLWDPYTFFGIPLLSRPDSLVFYPPLGILVLIGSLLNISYTQLFVLMEGMTVLHLSFAGIATYLVLRKVFDLEEFPSFIGGLVFMLNGNLIAFTNTTGLLMSMSWLPLQFLFFHNLVTKPNFKNTLLSSVSFALPITTFAWQNSIIYHMIYLGGYYMYLTYTKKVTLLSSLPFVLSAGILSLALSAVVIIPGLQVPKISDRADLNFGLSAYSGNMRLRQVLDMFLPYNLSKNFGERETIVLYEDLFPFAYAGLVPLLLTIPATFKRRKFFVFVLASFVLLFLFGLGGNTAVFDLFYSTLLPLMSPFRNVAKVLYISFFSLSVLVAFGTSNILESVSDKNLQKNFAKYRSSLKRLLMLSCVAFIVYVLRLDEYIWTFRPGAESVQSAAQINVFTLFLINLGAGVASLYLIPKNPLAFKKVLAIIIFLDLFTFAKNYPINNYGIDPNIFVGNTNAIKFVNQGDQGVYRTDIREFPHNYAAGLRRIRHIDGYLVYRSSIVNNFLGTLSHPQRNNITDNIARVKYVVTKEVIEDPAYELVFQDFVQDNNKYYIRGSSPSGWAELGPGNLVNVYENKNIPPYFNFVSKVFLAEDADAKVFLQNGSKDFDPSEHVIVTPEQKNLIKTALINPQSNSLEIQNITTDKIELKIDMQNEGLIATGQPYYDDWVIESNGVEVEKIKTNLSFTGFYLPKGTHNISMYFKPKGYELGLLISILSSTFVGTSLVALRIGKK